MELEKLTYFFDKSPVVRLLSAQNAAFMIDFFMIQFKNTDEISVPHERLLAELIDYQEAIQEIYPDRFSQSASDYLTQWCGEGSKYLRRFFDTKTDEPLYQLTDASETAIRFVQETLERQDQVTSSESRIRTIIDTLRDISTYATNDPEKRLAALLEQRDKIEAEIQEIRDTWHAEPEHEALIRSKFHFVVDLLRRVLSDFRLVEEAFRKLTREVQQREVSGTLTKGGLLGYVLEEEDALKESDYGVSFGEFTNLILSGDQQDSVRKLIKEVRHLDMLSHHQQGLETLRQMMPALTNEAEQVNRTIQRLSGSIRRFLDPEISSHLLRVGEMVGEIKQLAMKCSEEPPGNEFFIEVDCDPELDLPAMRDLRVPSAAVTTQPFQDVAVSDSARTRAFDELRKMRRLDWKAMQHVIRTETREGPVSLPRLLKAHPPKSGAIEVLAYVQIAKDEDHIIDPAQEDEVILPEGETYQGKRRLLIPRVVFRPANGSSGK
ncbi:MAG: DUF3375 family protein [Verrucomicrobiales bacterium]|nr:DUF3375 family protein [Verrucomicrobiales bacterium]